MIFIRPLSVVLVLLVTMVVSSCGFRLRNVMPFPKQWEPLYIESLDKFDDIEQSISVALDLRNIEITTFSDARSRIHILHETINIADVSVGTQTTKQLTIVWDFNFELYNQEKNEWQYHIQRGSVSKSKIFNLQGSTTLVNPEYRDLVFALRNSLAEALIRTLAQN